jgi:outer membrane protein assembly factor BamB
MLATHCRVVLLTGLCLLISLCLLIGDGAATAEQSDPQQQAAEILDATGIDGGLVVHLGCGDGRLTAALRAGDGFLVHGVDVDAASVDAARKHIHRLGQYGSVSIDRLTGTRLPYAENMVNLLVSENLGEITMAEVTRVLVPRGVAYTKQEDRWVKTVKPWPAGMDEWTHFLHGPDNNAVSHDQLVGPPRHIRWKGLPKFSRAHEQLASLSACVTAGGRMYYIVDETPRVDIRLNSSWYLVARDAFNGVLLWKKPLDTWADQFRRFRSGPAHLPFRLVADETRLFVTLGMTAPVTVLDAATGQEQQTIEQSEYSKQIIHEHESLALLCDPDLNRTHEIDAARRRGQYIARQCQIKRVDLETGELAWRFDVDELVFPCMALDQDRLFYQTPTRLGCLDYSNGRKLWEADLSMTLPIAAGKVKTGELQWEAPTLVVSDNLVMVSDFKNVRAFTVAEGKPVWSKDSSKGYNAPADVLVIDNLVWTKGKGTTRSGLDVETGDAERNFSTAKPYMHPRCYRGKATDRYLMLGEMGVQFVDVKTGEVWNNDWIRGTCQYGVMPANGLLYVTPDSCACNMKTKLSGLYALASKRATELLPIADAERLHKGPAYGEISVTQKSDPQDWPTYRHDGRRSGITPTDVPADLSRSWQTKIGGKLTSPVAAGGKVFVASIETHTVHALDATSGEEVWSFTAGGRIDSPPTIHRGLVLFGSADGSLYAVRASDGALAWRFIAAPEDRRCFSNGQLESVWPVHGSVLVTGDIVTVAAGRSSYLDGGIAIYQLDPASGAIVQQRTIFSPDPVTGKQPEDPNRRDVHGVLSDVMLADGNDIYMRHMKLDLETGDETATGVHLFSPIGLLDDTWWHRSYWTINDEFTSHWSGWWKVGNNAPSGRILCYDDDLVVGFGRNQYVGGNTGQWRGGEYYRLFALDRHATIPAIPPKDPKNRRDKGTPAVLKYHWTERVPLLVKGLVTTNDMVFIAGPPDVVKTEGQEGDEALEVLNSQEVLDAWNGKQGGMLWAVSRHDGSQRATYQLDSPPVFDGMAAAQGSLYVSTTDGSLVCYRGE